jgi:hypothetical protein
MAAVPAVGFLLLVKVAMTRTTVVAQPDVQEQPRPAVAVVLQPDEEPTPPTAGKTTPPRGDVPSAANPAASRARSQGAEVGLLHAGRQAAADLARRDVGLTRASLAAELRRRGVRVGTGRAGELLATLRAEQEQSARDQTAERESPIDVSVRDHHDRHLASVGTRL